MPANLEGLYFIRFIELDDETTNISLGQFMGFVSPNFLLVQPYCHTDDGNYTLFHSMKIMGIPHFENCLVFKTLDEAIKEFEYAMEDDEDCDGT